MDLADRDWRLIREDTRPGPMQMALDEIAAQTAADGGPRTVRVYTWTPDTLSMGYRQATDSVDWAAAADAGIDVTRRQTGGGGIYHDAHADISYSIVAPADELPGDLMDTYELLCTPVFDAFDRLGIDARFTDTEQPALHQPACYLRALNPAHDIVAGDPGRKISGNAQYRRADAVIQHGSLSFALDAERHLSVFSDPDTTPAAFREHVTTIESQAGVDRADAVTAVERALGEWADADEGEWTDAELARARDLAAEKYAADAWVRDRTAPGDA
ncbi:biotin/lipoate A/B protein ligase family protein [Halobacterium salinarum]|uniref:Lipoate--protein ligase domain protein n=1 Tax=Halobacterium salinarum (strain ATCC 33171 / DSM 3754 / JCM 8978 / NBRC 102687 / NCIMB 764 / 91-R6) TaxID=2597657 RepID=A0A4D6GQU9_HALS9|nr:biotin/lipoate A/B protein ligase family protein [Halobacterium salinarum]MDL0124535.1 biotin/lipoate A/B protein ligase family protein [Halobacterium salinarum]MDL0129474.1 biotin/lipoate A/B protein ligase family protein [Halobacterium salinarum]MDL0134113.1 biotin/lipoate A/B protein ligase family protein [Halobacterium salinarum]MDL0137398.1 biotin/lipoate A/B protein ligase family protein [Halobacterium salinarum]QCC44079.1 lipoate--protein ligase domain protein [Halobacterium salinaru